MKNISKLLMPLAVLFSLAEYSCVSTSTLQTARTLDAGKTQQTIGGGSYKSTTDDAGVKLESNLPYAEYSYRRGLAKDWDFGLKLTLLGSYAGDVKYQIYADDSFAVATGLGLGYLSYKISSGGEDTKVTYIDTVLPIYLSYDISKMFAVYVSPKYIIRSGTGDIKGTDQIKGLGLGTKIGHDSGVFAEIALLQGKDGNKVTQYNVSYFW